MADDVEGAQGGECGGVVAEGVVLEEPSDTLEAGVGAVQGGQGLEGVAQVF